MKIAFNDENNLIESHIDALALSHRERSRARAALAKADALVGAFFAVSELLTHRQKGTVMRPSLKPQK